jgi:predicted dehydrogenase
MANGLRVGIVGTGWGSIVHAPAFNLVDGYELAAICARNPDRLAKAAAAAGVEDTSNDWEEFVRREDLDIISVATPVELHHPIVLAALAAGRHVLCEKPLALTAEQAREMVAAAESSGRQTATCFELRWTTERLPIWDLVRGGYLGRPYFSRLVQSASYWHPSHKPQTGWMYDVAQGGGYLAGMLSHDIDWISTMFGVPTAICAEVGTTLEQVTLRDGTQMDVTADDTTALLLRLAGGGRAEISASVVGVHTAGWRFEAFGADGTIVATGGRGEHALSVGQVSDDALGPWSGEPRRPRKQVDIPVRGATSMILAMALMLEDWLPAFTGEATDVPTFRDGWLVQSVIEAARASSAGAGWVDIPQLAGGTA